MKMPIKEAMVWEIGNSAVITIPSDYVNNGQIQVGKKYSIIIEVPDD